MDVLLTGSSGFVGKNIIQYLGNEYRITSFFRNQEIIVNENVIIHLAGKAHDLKNTSNPDEYYQVNYELTKKLYDAFLASDASRFIFVSSVKAAADVVDGVLSEDISPNPKTHYGKSKLMAEEYIRSQPLPIGKSYYILRPCMIHGPCNKGNLNLLYNFVKKGLPYPLASFTNKRSLLSIENLCFVIKQIMEKDILSGVYNVADDDALSTTQIVSIIAKIIYKQPKLWHVSPQLIKLVAKIGDVLKLPVNSERLTKLTESYVVSNQKIKKQLGKNLPVKAAEGLITTIKSFHN